MKWAKTKHEYDKIHKALMDLFPKDKEVDKSVKEEMKYYVQIPEPSDVEDLTKEGFGLWKSFKNLDKYYPKNNPKAIARARTRYEIFIGGYIYYFDNHVDKLSSGKERTLYFDWGNINTAAALTIFLKPFFGITQKTPTNTNTGIDNYGNGNGNGKYNGIVNKQEEFAVLRNKPVVKMEKTTIAPPPALTDTDPPPPPPPPPPPRE